MLIDMSEILHVNLNFAAVIRKKSTKSPELENYLLKSEWIVIYPGQIKIIFSSFFIIYGFIQFGPKLDLAPVGVNIKQIF